MASHEQDDMLQRWKFFQGMGGVPFRTSQQHAPMYKNTDPAHRRPILVADMHVKQFDLADDAQRQEMEKILDLCAKGKCYQSKMESSFDPKTGSYKVLMIWGDLFLEDPAERQEGVNGRTHF